ncbi:MAG: hypothetical protein K2X66_05135 [Cyanobacteria bacterium]|nr:hypothetical protein [Cyanobacteriota bacterium]
MTITQKLGTFVHFHSAIQFEGTQKKESNPSAPPETQLTSPEKPNEKKMPIPQDINQQLKDLAKRFGQPLKKAQDMYRHFRETEPNKNRSNQSIFNIVELYLNPNPEQLSTLANGEEGGSQPTPPEIVSQFLQETGGFFA